MIENCNNRIRGKLIITSDNILLFVMYLAAFIAMVNPSLSIITGPIIAFVIIKLFTTDKYFYPVALIVIANDSLGTILLGNGSFYWLLFLLIVLKHITQRNNTKINIKTIIHFIIIQIFSINLYFLDLIGLKEIILINVFSISLFVVFNDIKDDKNKLSNFFYQMAIAIFLIAANAVIFNGVVFSEDSNRLGILGIGIGDPNFSCLILNIGIAILLVQKDRNLFFRILMIVTMVMAMLQTASITGIAVFSIIVFMYLLSVRSIYRNLKRIFIGLIASCVLIPSSLLLFSNQINKSILIYESRIEAKYSALQSFDYTLFTSRRSAILEDNLSYFKEEPILRQLIGGDFNKNTGFGMSHNTYLDILMRFGIVGAFIFFFFSIKKIIEAFRKYYKNGENGEIFLLKVVFAFFSASLSICTGHIFSLWYLILLIL